MNDSSPCRRLPSRKYSRRSLLAISCAGLLGIAGCADQASDRQFAGDPRTEEGDRSNETLGAQPTESGSPTAIPTRLPVAQLLEPRGDQTRIIAFQRHALTIVDVANATGREIWSEAKRFIWAAGLSPSSAEVALLTSSNDAPVNWAVEFVDAMSGELEVAEIGDWDGTSGQHPDAVTGGSGGLAWEPDSGSVVVALPTGGLLQVFPDGSQVRVAKAMVAKRPSAVAISPDGSTIAFIDQPSGVDGSGVFAGSMKAKPIDPIVVLPADRSGNRYAREVAWVGTTARVATIIDREEMGVAQGDLFFLDTHTRQPQLVWTSAGGRDIASVESFAISADTLVTAFLTNSIRTTADKPSALWMKQSDGASVERFDLPIRVSSSRIAFTPEGVAVAGIRPATASQEERVSSFLLDRNGRISLLYETPPMATPVASPLASPAASPVGSPSPAAVMNAE